MATASHRAKCIFIFLAIIAGSMAALPAADLRQAINFNRDWKFQLGDMAGADAVAFNDSKWDEAHPIQINAGVCPLSHHQVMHARRNEVELCVDDPPFGTFPDFNLCKNRAIHFIKADFNQSASG